MTFHSPLTWNWANGNPYGASGPSDGTFPDLPVQIRKLDDDGNPITTEVYLASIGSRTGSEIYKDLDLTTPGGLSTTIDPSSLTDSSTSETTETTSVTKKVLYIGNSQIVGLGQGTTNQLIALGQDSPNGFMGFVGKQVNYFTNTVYDHFSQFETQIKSGYYDVLVIHFGANSLNTNYTTMAQYETFFSEHFQKIIDVAKPYADIYVSTVLPIDYDGKTDTDAQLASRGLKLVAIANGVNIIDNAEFFGDTYDPINPVWAGDGAHLSPDGSKAWLAFLAEKVGGDISGGGTEVTESGGSSSSSFSLVTLNNSSTTNIESIGGNRGELLEEPIINVESQSHEVNEEGAFMPVAGKMNTTWDWGLGSVLEYTFGQKFKYVDYSYNEIEFHVHAIEDGGWFDDTMEFISDPLNYTESAYNNRCLGTHSIIVPSGVTADQLQEAIEAEAESILIANNMTNHKARIYGLAQGFLNDYTAEERTGWAWLNDILSHNTESSSFSNSSSSSGTNLSSSTDGYIILEDGPYPVYYVSQIWDPLGKKQIPGTTSSSIDFYNYGCGATTLSSVISTFYGEYIDAYTIAQWMADNGLIGESGTAHSGPGKTVSNWGLHYEYASGSEAEKADKIVNAMKNGNQVIILVRNASGTLHINDGGHYMSLRAYNESTGLFAVMNSANLNSKSTSYQFTIDQVIKAIDTSITEAICIVTDDPSTLSIEGMESSGYSGYNGSSSYSLSNAATLMRIQPEDYTIATRSFNHSTLSSYRSEAQSEYPIYVPIIKSAATMSGTIIYDYYNKTTREELLYGVGDAQSATTQILMNSSDGEKFSSKDLVTCHGYTTTAYRSGAVYTQLPYPVERTYPWGLEYLRDYASLYQAVIPNDVMSGSDFQARLSNSLESRWTQAEGEYANSYLSLIALGILVEEELYSEEYANIYGQQSISEIKLYSAEAFDMTEAMGTIQKNTVTNKPWLQKIINTLEETFLEDALDWVTGLLDSTMEFVQDFGRNKILGIDDPVPSLFIGSVNPDDMLDLITSTISFSQGTSYLDVESQTAESLEDMFIFVGQRAAVVAGTSPHEFYTPPGLSTVFEDAMSPTTGTYQVASSFDPLNSPFVTIKAPAQTSILAVADGTIVSVTDNSVRIVHTLGEDNAKYYITYGNLAPKKDGGIVIGAGIEIAKGTQVGMIADNGEDFIFTVEKGEGNFVEPMEYFYQDSEQGYGFISNVINVSALDETVKALSSGLYLANNYESNNRDRWHTGQGVNTYTDWTSTWWAWGRGAQYMEGNGYPVATILKNFGETSNYLETTSGIFKQGLSPKENSWVIFEPIDFYSTPVLAYVEAIVSDSTQITGIIVSYIPESTSGNPVREVIVEVVEADPNDGYFYWTSSSSYHQGKFIYLDDYIGTLSGESSSVLSGNYSNEGIYPNGTLGFGTGLNSAAGTTSGLPVNTDGWTLPVTLDVCGVGNIGSHGVNSWAGLRNGTIHRGVDVKGYEGAPLYAACSGTVVRAQWHDSWGWYIKILHPDGSGTLYAHMGEEGRSSHAVSVGDSVVAGQFLGDMGDTGNSFGAHLHFEYHTDGNNFDTYDTSGVNALWKQLYVEAGGAA